MDKNANPPGEAHDLPPADKTTREKIDKHLSDIDDTISEQDIKNVNTDTVAAPAGDKQDDVEEAEEIIKDKKEEDEDPEPEAPTPWEILGE